MRELFSEQNRIRKKYTLYNREEEIKGATDGRLTNSFFFSYIFLFARYTTCVMKGKLMESTKAGRVGGEEPQLQKWC